MPYSSSFDLEGKIIAVVGAASGIGAAVAEGCGRHRAKVVCFDVDAKAAEAAALRITQAGGIAEASAFDIRDGAAVDAAFEGVRARQGRLDVAIATPGVNVRKPLLNYTDEDFDRVIGVNLKGSLHVLQSAGRIMSAQGAGSIILFSSIRSQVVEPGQGVYAATKAGINQMVRTLAAELGPRGVRVNAIAPGVVATPLTAPIRNHPEWRQAYANKSVLGRWAEPEEMVGPAIFLASDAASYVTGSVLFVDGGWTAADGRFQPPGM
jgi:NAD(P)-dependent dehydrogenase (short-subunit alcohol dehydrogenase family)